MLIRVVPWSWPNVLFFFGTNIFFGTTEINVIFSFWKMTNCFSFERLRECVLVNFLPQQNDPAPPSTKFLRSISAGWIKNPEKPDPETRWEITKKRCKLSHFGCFWFLKTFLLSQQNGDPSPPSAWFAPEIHFCCGRKFGKTHSLIYSRHYGHKWNVHGGWRNAKNLRNPNPAHAIMHLWH